MPTQQKIRYSDTDPQGIVFNGNYARYWDDAITDWLWENGFEGEELGGIGADVVTARLEIDFKAAATLGDVLETTMSVETFGNSSMTVKVATRRVSDDMMVAQGRTIHVFVDPETFKPIAVPAEIRERLDSD